jgi:tetratricopeptide (TPR) repeat protein
MRKTVEENSYDFRHYLILGNFYNAARRFDPSYVDKAEGILTKAIELSPTNPQVYTSLGQTYLFKGNKDKAFALLQKAIDLEPEYTKSSLNLAESYVMMGEYEKGKAAFEKLFSENKFPLTVYYISRLIFAYEQLGEFDKAIAWSKEVVESKDGQTSAAAHFELADLYKKAGLKDEARETALKAKSLDPSPDVKKEIDKLLEEL